jgi:hypothetical protein
MDGTQTMARLGTVAHPITEQLQALRQELETGTPAPLS